MQEAHINNQPVREGMGEVEGGGRGGNEKGWEKVGWEREESWVSPMAVVRARHDKRLDVSARKR